MKDRFLVKLRRGVNSGSDRAVFNIKVISPNLLGFFFLVAVVVAKSEGKAMGNITKWEKNPLPIKCSPAHEAVNKSQSIQAAGQHLHAATN